MNASERYVVRSCMSCLLLYLTSLWLSLAAFVMNTSGWDENINTFVGKRTSPTCNKTGYVDFFLNNQKDALIIPILFCYKTLHVSGIFCAHHQEFSTVHSALVSFMRVFDDRFQAESGWDTIIPNLLCYKTLHVSGIFCAHHQEFSAVHSALVSFMQVFDDRFQAELGCDCIIQICSVIKLYMFRASSVPIIRSFLLYIRRW